MAAVPASLETGLYCAAIKKVRLATFVAFVVFVAFFAGMATTTKDSNMAVWGLPVLMGWALGMTLVAIATAAQLCVPHGLITTASCLLISVRSLGGTIGVAIYQAVFTSGMSHLGDNVAQAVVAAGMLPRVSSPIIYNSFVIGLPTSFIPYLITDLIAQNTTALLTVPGVSPDIIGAGAAALLDTYAASFKNVWVTAIAFVALAAIGKSSTKWIA